MCYKNKKTTNFKKYKKLLYKECFNSSKYTLQFLIHDVFTNVFYHFKHNFTETQLIEKQIEVKETLIANNYDINKTVDILKKKYNNYCSFCGNLKSKYCLDTCYSYALKKWVLTSKNQ